MSIREPLDTARRIGANAKMIANDSDRLFVRCARQLEEGVLQAAAGASLTALSMLPAMSTAAQRAAIELGRQSEHWARDERSLLLASVPGAAYRTAAVMEVLADVTASMAERAVRALFGGRRPIAEEIEHHYREIGRSVAELAAEGLDAWPLSHSIREHVKAIRRLKRR
jgi:hypothetical protein